MTVTVKTLRDEYNRAEATSLVYRTALIQSGVKRITARNELKEAMLNHVHSRIEGGNVITVLSDPFFAKLLIIDATVTEENPTEVQAVCQWKTGDEEGSFANIFPSPRVIWDFENDCWCRQENKHRPTPRGE